MSPVADEDDESVASAALSADFDEFFAAEYRSVVALAAVLTGRQAFGEEIAQEAFVRAFRRWDTIGEYDNPGGWVRRVVANLATSSWRTRTRETLALGRVWRRNNDVGEIEAVDDEIWVAVRALPSRQAQCIALHYLEDRSTADIAAVLEIAEATVRVHLHAGRKTLAAKFGEEEIE